MSTNKVRADANYRRELGDGLIERWSTVDDAENIGRLCSKVFRDSADEPINQYMIDSVHQQMRGDFPLMGPGNYALIEDTNTEGNPLVACTCLWRSAWEYEGIPFGVGQPEYVATDPAYRRRGLVRALFNMLHARSEAEGHLVQAITGISYFYRQFGYEYALELEGHRIVYTSLIPRARENKPEPYTLRAATLDDLPLIMDLHNRQQAGSMVWSVITEAQWRFLIEKRVDSAQVQEAGSPHMLVDAAGTVQGYLVLSRRIRGKELDVCALNIAADVNWQQVIDPLLRVLQSYGMSAPGTQAFSGPLSEIHFSLGSTHPVYEVLGEIRAPRYEIPYGWYVRVPNLLAFLRHITPALEQHLATSVAAHYTGELKLDLYREALHMVFDKGRITSIEPLSPQDYGEISSTQCPPLVFLQLLFGHRSLEELRYAFPDIQAKGEAAVLLKGLFPKKFSRVHPPTFS